MKLKLSLILLLVYSSAFAVIRQNPIYSDDTIFLHNKIITGTILDITPKNIIVSSNQHNLKIPLYKISKISFSQFSLPKYFNFQTLKTDQKTYHGYILYFNPLNSNILFIDYSKHQAISIPFSKIQNDTKLAKKIFLYKTICHFSLAYTILSASIIALSLLKVTQSYLSAGIILLAIALSLCYLFCRPIKHLKP